MFVRAARCLIINLFGLAGRAEVLIVAGGTGLVYLLTPGFWGASLRSSVNMLCIGFLVDGTDPAEYWKE